MRTYELVDTGRPAIAWSSAPGMFTIPTMAATEPTSEDNSIEVKPRFCRNGGRTTRLGGYPKLHSSPAERQPHRWGIVLAGGDGTRLQRLTKCVTGDDRPKQFCALLGDHTLLEETIQRAERSLPPEQILYSVTQAHQDYFQRDLRDRLSQSIVQPLNRGTGPAILSALLFIARADSDAIVSILPSDHYYSPESAFSKALETGFETAEQMSGSVMLLGVQPSGPEIEYGWIRIGKNLRDRSGIFQVEGFDEKPPFTIAQTLYNNGALWNTFVMVGHVDAFLAMASATVPRLMDVLKRMILTRHRGQEIRIPAAIYEQIEQVDFSRQILPDASDRLLALRLENVLWSDLGDPYRVLVTMLEKHGYLPNWVKLWPEEGIGASALAASA